ncbi:hypothetical protein ASB57_19790 [Bordetella sp. N]|nr:hypothetical protein ASB57_19790 [Bordetella sp. N]
MAVNTQVTEAVPNPGKPPKKIRISVRLSLDVVEGFRATGHGWQARVNQVLKDWLQARSAMQQERDMNKT